MEKPQMNPFLNINSQAMYLPPDMLAVKIISSHLTGLVDENGCIEMHYRQVNVQGALMRGICYSKPELLENGQIRLDETWEWTPDRSKGISVIEEE